VGTRIYVGNLSYDTTEEGLRRHFESEDRTVKDVHIVTDHVTGRSRGFAFVEVGDDAQLNAAIQTLNGTSLDNRQLNLSEARPRQARSEAGGSARPPSGPRPPFNSGPSRPPRPVREPRAVGAPPVDPWAPPPDPDAAKGGRGERRKRNLDRQRNEDHEDDDW